MVSTVKAKVMSGQVVLPTPLELPDGMEVSVSFDQQQGGKIVVQSQTDPFEAFLGIWSDREDMRDAVGWVDKERSNWQSRNQTI